MADFGEKILTIKDLAEVIELLSKHQYSETCYYKMGLSLGLSPNTMDAIEKDHNGDTSRCYLECLKKWLQKADQVESKGGSTLKSLIDALRKSGQEAVAYAIEEEKQPACSILSRNHSKLTQSIIFPIDLTKNLYDERVLSESSRTLILSIHGSRVKRTELLLNCVRDAICTNHADLEKFARVLMKFLPSARDVAQDIITDYEAYFTDYSKWEVVLEQGDDYDDNASSASTDPTIDPTDSEKGKKKIFIPLSWRPEFTEMRLKFGKFFSHVQKAIKNHSSFSTEDLVDLLENSFSYLRSQLHHNQTLRGILTIVRQECTLINIKIIEVIVEEFEVTLAKESILNYKKDITTFCREIRTCFCIDENFRVVKGHRLLDCELATFVLDWDADKQTLDDVREIISEAFGKESNVSIEVISKANSIKVVCSFLVSDAIVLIANATHNMILLKKKGLLYLRIGYCTLYDHQNEQEENKAVVDLTMLLKNKEQEIEDLKIKLKNLELKETNMEQETMAAVSDAPAPPIPVRSSVKKRDSVETDFPAAVIDAPAPPIPKRATAVKKRNSVGTETLPHPPLPVSDEADGSHLTTPTILLSECGWYWKNISREDVTAKLQEAPDGSFLVRDSQEGTCPYTLTVRIAGQNKLIRIIYSNGLYGFSEPTQHRSVPDLIDYYREVSLSQFNPRLDVKLVHPISRLSDIIGAEEEKDEDNDIEELLEKLIDVSKLFDSKHEAYIELEKKSEEMKTEIESSLIAVEGYDNDVDSLKKHQLQLHHNLAVTKMKDEDRKNVIENVKLLSDKISKAENLYMAALQQRRDCKNRFSALTRDLNTLRPELMRLQWQKDQYVSKLIQEGLSRHEISERVEGKRMEGKCYTIYGLLYGMLEDDEYAECYELPLEIQSMHNQGSPPPSKLILERYYDEISEGLKEKVINQSESTDQFESTYVMLCKKLEEQEEDTGCTSKPHPLPLPSTEFPPPLPTRKMSLDRQLNTHSVAALPTKDLQRIKNPVPSLENYCPHNRQETWYVECDRAQAGIYLQNKQDGTFLCRPSGKAKHDVKSGVHTHTVDIVYKCIIRHLPVIQDSQKYGFSFPCRFNSLLELILYYSENSLEIHNPHLTTTLIFPIFS